MSRNLLFYVEAGDILVPTMKFPDCFKKKAVYFIKARGVTSVTNDNVANELIYGELSSSPLEHLQLFLNHVTLPLLNTTNTADWPDVMVRDITKHLDKFISQTTMVGGKMDGHTVLPVPSVAYRIVNGDGQVDRDVLKDAVHSLETIVIDWAREIRQAIQNDTDSIPMHQRGPIAEIDFWKAKQANLQAISQQLLADPAVKVRAFLTSTGSSFAAALDSVADGVGQAMAEAADTVRYLEPLRRTWTTVIEETDPAALVPLFPRVLHVLMLIHKHSGYYRTQRRTTGLLRRMCDELIEDTFRQIVDPETVLKMEPDAAQGGLQQVLRVADVFRTVYRQYAKTITDELNAKGVTPRGADGEDGTAREHWPDEDLVFRRMDNMLSRFRDIHDLMATATQLARVQKIEVGGMRGKLLSVQLEHISTEFEESMLTFTRSTYDPADLSDGGFEADYQAFRRSVKDWEKRLCAILIQAFDDTYSLEGKHKLLEAFAGVLAEESLTRLITKRFLALLELFHDELQTTEAVFDAQSSDPPIAENMAPVSGRIQWANALKNRVTTMMAKLDASPAAVLEDERYVGLVKPTFTRVVARLDAFSEEAFSTWSSTIDAQATAKLKTSLLVRDDDGLLRVNFHPALSALLKEMAHLTQGDGAIPDEAATIYAQADQFRRWTAKLDVVVSQYNTIHTVLLPVERPLVALELNMIDRQLKSANGLLSLMWSAREDQRNIIDRAVEMSRLAINELHAKVTKAKARLTALEDMLTEWATKPLLNLDGRRSVTLVDEEAEINKRVAVLVAESKVFEETIAANAKQLQARTSTDVWAAYVQYITDLIGRGVAQVILTSLTHLSGRMRLFNTEFAPPHPLLDVKLDLITDLIYSPPMMGRGSVVSAFNSWVMLFLELPRLLRRPTDPEAVDGFLPIVGADPKVLEESEALLGLVEEKCTAAENFLTQFADFQPYWSADREAYLKRFLECGPNTTLDGTKEADLDVDEKIAPVLYDFDQQIVKFRKLEADVGEMNFVQTHGWLRTDGRPLKQALLSTFGKWTYLFTRHLGQDVKTRLADARAFVDDTTAALSKDMDQISRDELETVLRCQLNVKVRAVDIDGMWDPARETVALLARYDVPVPEDIAALLDALPSDWEKLRRLSFSTKEKIAPQQQMEVQNIKEADVKFEGRLLKIKGLFRTVGPFAKKHTPAEAYHLIDSFRKLLEMVRADANRVQEQQQLFELDVNPFNVIDSMSHELGLLKSVWDVIGSVDTQLAIWRRTLWNDINIEFMEDETKKFVKEIRGLDKLLRAFEVFSTLETDVKNFLATLPLVADLKNPSMRDRHWKQLMRLTKKEFVIGTDFKLSDLLALQLHSFSDEVGDIVDKASKELGMEKTLTTLDGTWGGMEFAFGTYDKGRDKVPLLQVDETQIETLEDNQVVVQNMAASKYVGHFQEEVARWQANLSTVDSVITLWTEVQQTWSHLEPIFVGSDDIRQQLAQHAQRFDTIHSMWMDLMNASVHTPNIVALCTKAGMEAQLEQLESMLAECEKALADYLDTKRRAFPRFYFISSTALLDILSKGRQPLEVEVHLSKLFDSIKALEWETDDAGEKTDVAIGMYSREMEYIPFVTPCHCEGQVEVWLNRLVDAMRATIRHQMSLATEEYMGLDRIQWILKWPAQIALVGSQIWWTSEVNQAFSKLEEGNENAVKEYNKKQTEQLIALIKTIQGDLAKDARTKIMTITTIDVHARDVITGLVDAKIESAASFAWQSQLKLRWDDTEGDCFIDICDANFRYWHEYLGNQPRLVITPLTDRCYITLTQSLHLIMGGAPAGPAGTGKTETTKDLGRALGLIVYVFNCSEQMDYRSLGNIFQGLASSGAFGCFDEFNRISIEVLSVVSNQVKCILDAIRAKKVTFDFQGTEITLVKTVGMYFYSYLYRHVYNNESRLRRPN